MSQINYKEQTVILEDVEDLGNYTDKNLLKLIATTTAMKHVQNNTICKPYLKKHTFNPFKIEELAEAQPQTKPQL